MTAQKDKKRCIRFGTDGWRAVISEEFTMENVQKVAQAICDVLKKRKLPSFPQIVIGYDTRFLSEEYGYKIAEVFLGNGFFVILSSKFSPTPIVSYAVVNFKAVGGIVVTASHNAFQFNGIKFKDFYGGPVSTEFTEQVESQFEKTKILKESIDCGLQKDRLFIKDFDKPYFDFVRSYVSFETVSQCRSDIMVDSMYGSGQGYFESLLELDFQGKCTFLHNSINPNFGGVPPEPIAENLKELISYCREYRCIGFATDGDADRIGVVDEKGNFIFSHQIIALLFLYLIQTRQWNGGVAKSLSTTALLDSIAKDKKRTCYETRIGFKHIASLMTSEEILIGGEESGGIGFKNHVPERDGILSAFLILEMMGFYQKPLYEIIAMMDKKYGHFYYRREDIVCDKSLVIHINDYRKHPTSIDNLGVVSVDTRDGLKYLLDDGSWILMRLSGTECVLRIYAESQSQKRVSALIFWARKFCLKNNDPV